MDVLRIFAIIFGVVFILVGFAGFMPQFVTDGNLLLGMFEIDVMHNWIHIISGAVALLASLRTDYARLYFKIFGVVYGVVTIWGFVAGGNVMHMHMNMADNFLHLAISVVALFLGFVFRRG